VSGTSAAATVAAQGEGPGAALGGAGQDPRRRQARQEADRDRALFLGHDGGKAAFLAAA